MSTITARSVFRWNVAQGKVKDTRFGHGPAPMCHPTKKPTAGRLRNYQDITIVERAHARYNMMLQILYMRAQMTGERA